MPFDANKFNFTRVKHDEILFELSTGCDGERSTGCDGDNEGNVTVSFK